jgi:hypothetical protein
MNNKKIKQYVAGAGCECSAWSEGECGCGADWTVKEVYVLRNRLVELEKERDDLYAYKILSIELCNRKGYSNLVELLDNLEGV